MRQPENVPRADQSKQAGDELAARIRETYERYRDDQIGLRAPIHPEYLYNSAEVAEVLGVSERTLRRWMAEGYGPKFHRLKGRMLRARGQSVIDFVSNPPDEAT